MILTSLCALIIVAFLVSFVLFGRTLMNQHCINQASNQTLREQFYNTSHTIATQNKEWKKEDTGAAVKECLTKEILIQQIQSDMIQEGKAQDKQIHVSPANAHSPNSSCPQKYKIIIFWVAFCFFSALCFVPMVYHTSIVRLWYSYFDSPSFLAFVLLCGLALRLFMSHCQCTSVLPLWFRAFFWQMRLNLWSACVLVVYGVLLYGGALGMIGYDIYHLAPIWQGIISFALLIALYLCQRFIGIAGLCGLGLSCLFGGENVGVLEVFICPFLWLYCVIFVVVSVICKMVARRFVRWFAR